ncbi:(S)-2-hydroxy-acid oxidase [Capronia coronata CBS 617.96]|uniref:Oxidase FUB9 n=1 Tax=Capronia coronata CBS 617.96 TaxID=1182541 RepID=W9XYP0_9EURO|nr:(S)-2-hydroxy-acid oxidase [Capronia coronata CBS 617.96]EXJ82091.1 (S)-2-hydroxy-acid oxidase [Capronia coronata CBS 617.96]
MAPSTPEPIVMTIADLKEAASRKMAPMIRDYYNGGSMDQLTLRDNESSFNRFKIRPRILSDVSNIDTSITIMGQKVPLPFGFAPAAMHCLAHPDGEKATSRAAAKMGIPMGLSTYSTVSLEDVRREGGDNPYAFQLSILKDRQTSLAWIKRAEAAGYKALFITVDAPVLGKRINERSGVKFELPETMSLPNLSDSMDANSLASGKATVVRSYKHSGRDASNSWQSVIPWVKTNTKLEIWLKGIYCAEDVQLAIKYELDGVIVSNHGGRQLDGVPATIDALPECAAAAKGRIKVGIDGGIRRGTDIFKALALGADVCFMGRVPLWGLAYNGQEGVEWAIKTLEEELRTAMALAGCASIKEISRQHLSIIGANGLLARL